MSPMKQFSYKLTSMLMIQLLGHYGALFQIAKKVAAERAL